jgi:hypothetical protein
MPYFAHGSPGKKRNSISPRCSRKIKGEDGKKRTGHGRFYYLRLNQRLKSRAEGFLISYLSTSSFGIGN